MPRQVRIQYAGAIYHVMARGDRREAIFRDDLDRRMLIWDTCTQTGTHPLRTGSPCPAR